LSGVLFALVKLPESDASESVELIATVALALDKVPVPATVTSASPVIVLDTLTICLTFGSSV
jgi:hypothetical protein